MDSNFWQDKWQRGDIGFHESAVNPLLVAHVDKLALTRGARVFLPLCGKTLDIAWLLARGMRVVGVELSQLAVDMLFTELGVTPKITPLGTLQPYQAEHIDIFNGDIFTLNKEQLGPVDAIYDRAALVALPAELRERYVAHMRTLNQNAPELLVIYEYDQSVKQGPPFSVEAPEVERLYGEAYHLEIVERQAIPATPSGRPAAMEVVWWLRARLV
ncbi:MAG: thiopurine S-methyltransferase [Pseudomonadales bacterium]|jgi:thiopurine S-methyltransferase|nr:thiopurine S-methyltransferase [Pseudomonadales bacterium]